VLAAAVAALGLCVAPATAAATTLYASPLGDATTSDCTSPDPLAVNPPCEVNRAVETIAVDGDEVILSPGDYNVGADPLEIAGAGAAINVHGADGQPLPRIIVSADPGVSLNNPGASLRRLAVEHSGTGTGLNIVQTAGPVEQVSVHTTAGSHACQLRGTITLRDSICANSNNLGLGNPDAVHVESFNGGPFTANLRNVTAIATGAGSSGIEVFAVNVNNQQALVAKNVIANGVSTDVHAQAGSSGSSATVTLSSSNYATELESPAPSGTATITDPGAPNQTAPPLFMNFGAGDFHQALGSPTIDAGAAVDLMGSADIDGDARSLGVSPDIGADEFIPLPPSSLPPSLLPPTTVAPTAPAFDLTAAIRHCRKKFRKGTKARRHCIRKAKAKAHSLGVAGT